MLASRVSPAGTRDSVLPRAPPGACRDRSCVRQLRACPQKLPCACRCPLCCLAVSSAAARRGQPRADALVNAPPTTLVVAGPLCWLSALELPHGPAIGMLPPCPELHRSAAWRPSAGGGACASTPALPRGPGDPGSLAGWPLRVSGGCASLPQARRSAQSAEILALLPPRAKVPASRLSWGLHVRFATVCGRPITWRIA